MFITLILSKARQWLVYRETIHELESLTDQALSDLGIDRGRIKEIARQAAL
jgi:uncharacterized protein YjiS (DUF1127 family)